MEKYDKGEEPLVSVIIPTYNRANLIKRSLKSVLDQTYKNLEIIIVNDGSTDKTDQIISSLIAQDKRIKYYCYKKNRGAVFARNLGIKKSSSKYIAFQDTDDVWFPTKLEKQVNKSLKNSQIDLVYTGISYRNKKDQEVARWTPRYKGNKLFKEIICREIIPGTPTILVKKSTLTKVNNFTESPSNQDYILYIKLAAKNCYFDYIAEPLVKVYQQKRGITSNIDRKVKGRRNVILLVSQLNIESKLKNRALANQHFRLGVFYELGGNRKLALRSLFKTIKLNPLRFSFYIYIAIMVLLPPKLFKILYFNLKKKLGDYVLN